MPQGEISVAGTLVEISAALQATRTRKEVLRVLIRERVRVESDRTRVAGTVAGPIVMALLFAGMAGAMLPGVQGFAETNFQLTTPPSPATGTGRSRNRSSYGRVPPWSRGATVGDEFTSPAAH